MLYVDGMTGVMDSPKAIQFLYKLISASNPLVCKTATKLLVVFVEYNTETNCSKLVTAINDVDKENGVIPWTDVMSVVQKAAVVSGEAADGGEEAVPKKAGPVDTELAMYGVTLMNIIRTPTRSKRPRVWWPPNVPSQILIMTKTNTN